MFDIAKNLSLSEQHKVELFGIAKNLSEQLSDSNVISCWSSKISQTTFGIAKNLSLRLRETREFPEARGKLERNRMEH